MQNISKNLKGGAAWIAATRAGVNLIGFISTIILARLLTPSDFGLVALATTVAAIIASLTELSLTSALVQRADATDSHFDTAFTLNMIRATLVGLVTSLLAVPIARFYGDDRLIAVIILIAAGYVIAGATSPKLVVLTRKLIFWQEFAVNVGAKLAGIIPAAAIAFIFRSYWALAVGVFASQLASMIISHAIAPYRPHLSLSRSRELFGFSAWVTVSEIINTMNWRMDQLFLGAFAGQTTVGQYAFGNNVSMIATRELTTPLSQTLFPAFSRMNNDTGRLNAAYVRSQALIACISLPLGIGFAFVASTVVPLVVGSKWQGAVMIIQVLAPIMAFQTLSSPYRALAMAVGRLKLQVFRDFGSLLVRFPLTIGGLFFFGITGFLVGRALAGAVNILLSMTVARQILGLSIREQLLANLRTLLAIAAMTVTLWALQSTWINGITPLARIAIEIVTGACAYLFSLFALWHMAKRPFGPETDLIRAAQGVFAKVSAKILRV